MTRVKRLSLRLLGSGFHADGLANEKALLPYVDVFKCVTSSCPLAVERSDCPSITATARHRFIAFGDMPCCCYNYTRKTYTHTPNTLAHTYTHTHTHTHSRTHARERALARAQHTHTHAHISIRLYIYIYIYIYIYSMKCLMFYSLKFENVN